VLEASLLRGSADSGDSLHLEREPPEALRRCLGYVVLFSAVDAGGALEHAMCGSLMEVALVPALFQLLLYGLQLVAGRLNPRRSGKELGVLLSGPAALLAVEVFAFALSGELSEQMLMDEQGWLQEAPMHAIPETSDALALFGIAAVGAIVASREELSFTLRQASATASGWAGLRGVRWMWRSWRWLTPGPGSFRSELGFAVTTTVLALLTLGIVEHRWRQTRSPNVASNISRDVSASALGLCFGLLWTSRVQRAAIKVVPTASLGTPLIFLVALLLLWKVVLPFQQKGPDNYHLTGGDSPKLPAHPKSDALRQGLRLYRALASGPALCPPSVLPPRGRGSYPDPHDLGDLAQPGPRLCLEEPGPTLILPLE